MKRTFLALLFLLALALPVAAELAPAQLDLTARAGETFTVQRRLRAGGRIADLTGAQVKAQIRKNYSDTQPLAEFAVAPLSASGIVSLTLTSSQTTALSGQTGYWDLLIVWLDGSRQYLAAGRFKCLPSVTR